MIAAAPPPGHHFRNRSGVNVFIALIVSAVTTKYYTLKISIYTYIQTLVAVIVNKLLLFDNTNSDSNDSYTYISDRKSKKAPDARTK